MTGSDNVEQVAAGPDKFEPVMVGPAKQSQIGGGLSPAVDPDKIEQALAGPDTVKDWPDDG